MSENQETIADIVAEREVGNGAKMREALAPFPSLCEWLTENAAKIGISDMVPKLRERCDLARAALAAPPRACDILSANELKLQVFAGLAYQIKIKGFNIRGLEELLKSVAWAVIDIAYDTNEEGKTND